MSSFSIIAAAYIFSLSLSLSLFLLSDGAQVKLETVKDWRSRQMPPQGRSGIQPVFSDRIVFTVKIMKMFCTPYTKKKKKKSSASVDKKIAAGIPPNVPHHYISHPSSLSGPLTTQQHN